MSNRRVARLNEQMKREISEILRTEVRDPRIGHPTVTAVEVTPDLWSAKVFVRPDPTGGDPEEADHEALLEGLGQAATFIRSRLGRSLTLRRVPELRFKADRALEKGLRIERILREVLPERDVGPDGSDESNQGGSAGEDSPGDDSARDESTDPGGSSGA